jgi:hypothetical protein
VWEQGGVARRATPSSSSAPTALPEWLQSGLEVMTGRGISRGNLYNTPAVEDMRKTLPEAVRDTVCMTQLNSHICANGLVTGRGSEGYRMHDKDGTRVAWTDNLAFLTCVKGTHKIADNYQNAHCRVVNMFSPSVQGAIQPVDDVRGRCIHWAMLSKEELEGLEGTGQWLGDVKSLLTLCTLLFVDTVNVICTHGIANKTRMVVLLH